MDQLKYVLVENNNKVKYKGKIINYYNHYFPEESNKLIVKNSTVFWLAKKNNKIVGILRMLTDYSRYALLLDLIVKKAERKQGIGKKLVKLAEEYCINKQIKHLILTTDPHFNWLIDFYKELRFKVLKNQSLMEFKH